MKVDFNAVITNMDGKPVLARAGIQDVFDALTLAGVPQGIAAKLAEDAMTHANEKVVKSEALTARVVCTNALGAQDQAATGAQLVERMELALRIRGAKGPVEIGETEKGTILERVLKLNPIPAIYFRVKQILDTPVVEEVKADLKVV